MDEEELGQDEESPPSVDIPPSNTNDTTKQQFNSDEINSDFRPDQEGGGTSNAETEDGATGLSTTTDLGYSLYICPYFDEMYASFPKKLKKCDLENLIKGMKPVGQWIISETSCGLIASFNNQDDMLTVLKQNLSDELKGPVQVAQFSSQDTKYRQSVMIRDVPWAIPLQEVSEALNKQGIHAVSIERARQAIKVEMNDAIQYENLLRSGFDFFGVARFPVVSGRWRFLLANSMYSIDNNVQTQDLPVQCYRCQGFWHIAANCRQLPRCVRCGESHTVEFCPRPRQSPICCHCAGPHHAAYRHCPVRQQLLNSTPVSLSLSTAHRNPNHPKRTNLPT